MEKGLNQHGLSPAVTASIVDLARHNQVEKLILFGSRARSTHRSRSDIDLAVRGGDVVRFTMALDEEVTTLLSFDVVDLDSRVQPELLTEIEKDGVVLYEKDR